MRLKGTQYFVESGAQQSDKESIYAIVAFFRVNDALVPLCPIASSISLRWDSLLSLVIYLFIYFELRLQSDKPH